MDKARSRPSGGSTGSSPAIALTYKTGLTVTSGMTQNFPFVTEGYRGDEHIMRELYCEQHRSNKAQCSHMQEAVSNALILGDSWVPITAVRNQPIVITPFTSGLKFGDDADLWMRVGSQVVLENMLNHKTTQFLLGGDPYTLVWVGLVTIGVDTYKSVRAAMFEVYRIMAPWVRKCQGTFHLTNDLFGSRFENSSFPENIDWTARMNVGSLIDRLSGTREACSWCENQDDLLPDPGDGKAPPWRK